MSYGTTNGGSQTAGPAAQSAQAQNNSNAAGPSDGVPPPSYAQVVAGDNKVQSQE